MTGATDPIAATAAGRASGEGRLTTVGRPYRPLSGRQKILKGLNRVFDRTHRGALALRINAPEGLAGGLRWRIAETPALQQRVLRLQSAGREDVVIPLEGKTIREVRDAIAASPLVLAYATADNDILVLDALALVPGEGEEWVSNGDHIYARASLLWAWADPIGRWLDQSRLDIAEMLRMLVVRQSGGYWSELWASYFGLKRRVGELDASLNQRTEWEWRRARSNPKAMELNIIRRTGEPVRVREPWREMMVVSGSEIGGGDHLPNEEEFAYHRAQLTSREFVDWDAATEEAEADRPAGTLMIAPVTTPWPWHIVVPTPTIEFGGDPTTSERIQDFDGQIISVTWNLSDTFVLLNPAIATGTDFEFTSEPLGDAGDIGNRLTFAIGEMIVSEQWPLGHQQQHLSGRMQIEVGGGLVASGDTALSDYENSLEWVPIDEWLVDERAFDPGEPLTLPAQDTMESEQSAGGVIAGAGLAVTESGEEYTATMAAGSAYSTGWTGRWDKRKWRGAYPNPIIGFGSTSYSLGGGGSAGSTATGSLTTASRLVGTAAAAATGSAALRVAVRFAATRSALATASGSLRVEARLAATRAGVASASASLSTAIRLAGSRANAAASSGALSTAIRLAAGATVEATATGSMQTAMVGPGVATATASGSLTTGIRLAGTGAGTATGAATMRTGALLAGSGAATATRSAALTTAIRLAGAGTAAATGTATMRTGALLAGSGTCAASTTAWLSTLSGDVWAPTSLGSALIYATDTNDTAAVPNDGTGKAEFAKHKYDHSKSLSQPVSSNRPTIINGSGATWDKRALGFGSSGMLLAGGVSGSIPELVTLFNNASMSGGSGTIIMAAGLDAPGGYSFLGCWSDLNADNYVQLRQNYSDIAFQATSTGQASATGTRSNGWALHTGIKDGSTLIYRRNGTVRGTATLPDGQAAFAAYDFSVGGYGDIGGFAAGLGPLGVTGILITNTVLTGTDLANAEAWVMATAGLT